MGRYAFLVPLLIALFVILFMWADITAYDRQTSPEAIKKAVREYRP